jgi:WD40 repeat protein
MDCWHKMKPLTSSADRSVRVWKVETGSHLVFRKHSAPIDCVQYLSEERFLSSGQDGRINIWSDKNRSPVSSVQQAHGLDPQSQTPRWICSLAAAKGSDCFASGSHDGFVRIWSCGSEGDRKSPISPLVALPMQGFVNALALTKDLVVAATSREHRLGRWWSLRHSEAKDRLTILRLNVNDANGVVEDSEDASEEDEDEADSGEEA